MKRIVLLMLLSLSVPALYAQKVPDWISGASKRYPADKYLIGVGLGNSIDSARSNARAEIAKIFSARVFQSASETQSESRSEKTDKASSSYINEAKTSVTTDEVLEGVEISETYLDNTKKTNYALAVLEKAKLRNALAQKILDQEEVIKAQVDKANATSKPVEIARAMSKSLAALSAIEAIADKKKIVDPVAVPSMYAEQKSAMSKRLENAISNIVFIVDPAIDQELSKAINSKLSKLGFTIIASLPADLSPQKTFLIVKYASSIEPLERNNPQWKFYAWQVSIDFIENSDHNTVLASGLKEGQVSQLNDKGAKDMASLALINGAQSCVDEKVKSYIFGE